MLSLFRKKNETKNESSASNAAETIQPGSAYEIKILGGGCCKCHELESTVHSALAELEIHASIEHITDFAEIASYGVMVTPALVINGKVVSCGKVLKKDDVKNLICKAGK